MTLTSQRKFITDVVIDWKIYFLINPVFTAIHIQRIFDKNKVYFMINIYLFTEIN